MARGERRSRWPRWAGRAALCLVLGLVTSVVVSWAAASTYVWWTWPWTEGEVVAQPDGGPPFALVLREPARERVRGWDHVTPRDVTPRAMALPAWWRARTTDNPEALQAGDFGGATGWPAACMSFWVRFDAPTGVATLQDAFGGAVVEDPRRCRVAAPLAPVWPGMAFDTVFYGAWWCAVLAAGRSLRHPRRRGAASRGDAPRSMLPSQGVIVAAIGLAGVTTLGLAWAPQALRSLGVPADEPDTFLSRISRDTSEAAACGLPARNVLGLRPELVGSDAAGWPLRCLGCDWAIFGHRSVPVGGSTTLVRGGALLDASTVSVGVRTLPMRPLWGGLVVDVALFAGAWLCVVAVCAGVRRRVRRRRGKCGACGFDLTGSTGDACPECGAAIDRSIHA